MSGLGHSVEEQLSRGKLESAVASAGHLARQIGSPDMGIDGDIEFCASGLATGARLAFQLKTGPSYVSSTSDTHINIKVECKHLRYWCCVNLPVLLVYYDGSADVLYWEEVKYWLLRSGFEPTSQTSTVVPLPKANTIPGDCTDKWREIVSTERWRQDQIQERFRLAMPELSLFRDPRFLPGAFAFTEQRFVVAESIAPQDGLTMINLPPELAPPMQTTTTLVTVFSHGPRSTGLLLTAPGSPNIRFDTIFHDTVPIEMTASFGSLYCRVDEGSPSIKLVCKGYGFSTR